MAAKKKLQPAVRYLRYELTNSEAPGTETSHYIDLARDVSAINRRLYRQGRMYHVKRVTIVSSNTPNSMAGSENRITFGTIPESWVAQQAWHRGFKTWTKMQKDAQSLAAGDVRATWNDFKVHLSYEASQATLLSPLDNGGNAVDQGEWIYSRMVSPS